MVTLYNVISSDGYIARNDDSEDFIPDELWPATLNFIKLYDALVMGRRTYDVIQEFPKELLDPFEQLPLKKVVVTSNRKDFHPDFKSGYVVLHNAEEVPAMGLNVLVSSGPTLNSFLLEKHLVDRAIFHQVQVEIGEGIKPFAQEIKDTLTLLTEKMLPGDVRELTYNVPH